MSDECTFTGNTNDKTGLRIASIFIIMATSMAGAAFPVFARRNRWISARIPQAVFDTAKYFGSGVIVRVDCIALSTSIPMPVLCADGMYICRSPPL